MPFCVWQMSSAAKIHGDLFFSGAHDMTIRIRCQGCQKAFAGPDSLAGKTVKCPTCGQKLTVPSAAAQGQPKVVKLSDDDLDSSADSELAPLQLTETELISAPAAGPAPSPSYGAPAGFDGGFPAAGYGAAGYGAAGAWGPAYPPQPGAAFPPGHAQQGYPPQGYPLQGGFPGQKPARRSLSKGAWIAISAGGAGLLTMVALLFMSIGGKPTAADTSSPSNSPVPGHTTSNSDSSNRSTSNRTAPSPTRRIPHAYRSGIQSEPEPTGWTAAADAGVPIEYPTEPISIPVPRSSWLTVPMHHSYFACVSATEGANLHHVVFDLRTGEPTAELIHEAKANTPTAINFDGTYLATRHGDAYPGRNGLDLKVRLTSLASGATVAEMKLEESNMTFGFSRNDRLMIVERAPYMGRKFEGLRVTLINPAAPQNPQQYVLKETPKTHEMAVSAGGKYLAFVQGTRLYLNELETGKLLGIVALPEPEKYSRFSCKGLAFSPNGREIVGYLQQSSEIRLVRWDATSGKELKSYSVPIDSSTKGFLTENTGDGLEISASGDCYLIGRKVLFDRESGVAFHGVAINGGFGPLNRLLERDRVLKIESSERNAQLITHTLSPDQLAAAIHTAKAGGKASDAKLGLLLAANLYDAPLRALPETAPWNVPAVNPPPAPALPWQPLPMGENGLTLLGGVFSPGSSGFFAISLQGKGLRRPDNKTGDRNRYIQRYDLKNRTAGNMIEVPEERQPLAISPRGDEVLVWQPSTIKLEAGRSSIRERLDMYSFEKGEHLYGWRPYRHVKKANPHGYSSISQVSEEAVAWADFTDDNHVLTLDAQGNLVQWQLPDVKPLWRIESFGAQAALTPDRAAVVGSEGFVVAVADGRCLGQLKNSDFNAKAVALAFSDDGTRLVAIGINRDYDEHCVMEWDWKSGNMVTQFWIPNLPKNATDAASIKVLKNRYVMLSQTYLVSLDRQLLIWQYDGGTKLNGPGEVHWIISSATGGERTLRAVELPHPAALQRTAQLTQQAQVLAPPGSTLQLGSISISVGQGVNPQDAVAAAFAASGYVIDAQSPVTISASQSESSTGGTSTFAENARGRNSVTVQDRQITSVLRVQDGRSRSWSQSRNYTNSVYSVEAGGDVAGKLNEGMRSMAGTFLGSIKIPRCLFVEFKDLGIGSSEITSRGFIDKTSDKPY